jgi:uncharacterized protein YraI
LVDITNGYQEDTMHIKSMICLAALMVFAAPVPSDATAVVASAITPLNIRSGPGPQYDVIGVINPHGYTEIKGCIQNSLWCQVDYRGRQGWAYSKYLTMRAAGQPLVITADRNQTSVPTVTYAAPVETVGSGVPTEKMIGTLIEPPADTASIQFNPPATVRTYVIGHPIEPTILNGEVVTGAGVPETVTLTPVPGYTYDYAYINRERVLVAPSTRRIVYVFR